ncbi:MAG: NUDIX domain-containing protein [Patescibacteria group bacterium]
MPQRNKFWAGGFLYNPQTNSVFLHQRDDKTKINPCKWAFFGGLNEGDKTPLETFQREMCEELGIIIPAQKIKPLTDYLNEELQTYRYVFFAESDVEKADIHLTEGADCSWIPLQNVFTYDLTEKTRRDLKTFLHARKK